MIYFLFVLVFPFLKMRNKVTLLYIALIVIIFVSCFGEDTLETQTGRMLFSVFAPILLFSLDD